MIRIKEQIVTNNDTWKTFFDKIQALILKAIPSAKVLPDVEDNTEYWEAKRDIEINPKLKIRIKFYKSGSGSNSGVLRIYLVRNENEIYSNTICEKMYGLSSIFTNQICNFDIIYSPNAVIINGLIFTEASRKNGKIGIYISTVSGYIYVKGENEELSAVIDYDINNMIPLGGLYNNESYIIQQGVLCDSGFPMAKYTLDNLYISNKNVETNNQIYKDISGNSYFGFTNRLIKL